MVIGEKRRRPVPLAEWYNNFYKECPMSHPTLHLTSHTMSHHNHTLSNTRRYPILVQSSFYNLFFSIYFAHIVLKIP